jgi:cytochrome P450
LQPRELLAHFLIVATAGHDTAATAIMGGVKALAENPDQWQLLREDPSKISGAVEEILRWVSPNLQFARTAKEDYVLHGQLIRKDESLALIYPSANRDEAVFVEPDKFIVTRTPNPHLAFGAGAHSCVGSQLARMELRCFFKTFVERIDDLELSAPTTLLPTNVVTRFEKMPVRYRFRQ